MRNDRSGSWIHNLARVQYEDEGKAGRTAVKMGTGKVADVPGDADAAVHHATQQTEGHTRMDHIPVGKDQGDNERRLQGNGIGSRATRQIA